MHGNHFNNQLNGQNFQNVHNNHHHGFNMDNKYQPLDEVTCFKCGEKGHYANRCNKGVFAFLRAPMDTNAPETK